MATAVARICITSGVMPLLIVGLAACGGATTSDPEQTAPPDSATTSSPSVAATSTSVATYCAPLAAAFKVKPPSGQSLDAAQTADLVKFGKLLGPAATAAAADGKTDVSKLLVLLGKLNSAPLSVTAEQAGEALKENFRLAPIIMADCRIDMMQ